MRILHLCLANFYVDGYNYQENVLPKLNKIDGHEVFILASTETFVENVRLGFVKPGVYITEDGIKIKRLAYKKFFSQFVSAKIRKYEGLYRELEKIKPDLIFMHNMGFGSVLEVVKYKKKNPAVKLYADTHAAYYNSGRNWLSMNLLHKIYYKYLIQKAVPFLEKYYYIGANEKKFSMEVYKVPKSIMEFFPLGGILPEKEKYDYCRKRKREELGLATDELLLVHTGKLDALKKTDALLNAFYSVKGLKAKLIIIGSIPDERKETMKKLIERDKRVIYLGWKKPDEMMEYFCASDLYCQPGSVSATLQNAICNFLPVLAYPFQAYLDIDCGNFIWVRNQKDIMNIFEDIRDGKISLDKLKNGSVRCAQDILDYKKLAKKYCQ